MPSTPLQFNHPEYDDEKIYQSIDGILQKNVLFSVATVTEENNVAKAWVNTAYYAYSPAFEFYFVTPPTAQHSKNLEINPSAALSIFDSQQGFEGKQGLQVFGSGEKAEGDDLDNAYHHYAARFEWLRERISDPTHFEESGMESRLYVVKPHTIKIFDEVTFGPETWVEVEI